MIFGSLEGLINLMRMIQFKMITMRSFYHKSELINVNIEINLIKQEIYCNRCFTQRSVVTQVELNLNTQQMEQFSFNFDE